jgi:hypothetical protein
MTLSFLIGACQSATDPIGGAVGQTESPISSPTPSERITDTPVASSHDPEIEVAIVPTSKPNEESIVKEVNDDQEAADADVEFVRAVLDIGGTWTFQVTLRHPDTGWDDYTDGWDVMLPDGTVLKKNESDPFTRLLLHPHENEQPFTRSQSGLVIPEGINNISVRAHDLRDGFGGNIIQLDLSTAAGTGYEIQRP